MKKGVFMKSALTEMQNQYMKLSYSERLFADYIFANRDQIIHMPIAELSQKIGIASSTVIAAIKKLDFLDTAILNLRWHQNFLIPSIPRTFL